MVRFVAIATLLLLCLPLHAIEVIAIKGNVHIGKQKLTKIGALKVEAGTVATGESSFIRLRFPENDSILTLGPSSVMRLNKDLVHEHKSGSALFKFLKKQVSSNSQVVVKTKLASFGVRGTEFMSVVNPLLNETEIITFEGLVEFKALEDSGGSAKVGAHQWGGIGGRFGNEIGKILTLPTSITDHFKNSFSF